MKLKTEFQDEDFRKGEVTDVSIATIPDGRIVARAKAKSGGEHTFYYDCIETLCNDWSDYEEPKKWFTISKFSGLVQEIDDDTCAWSDGEKESINELGFRFETREEAEEALEKLKAWKRLKDKGFRFNGVTPMEHFIRFTYDKPRQILDNQQHPEVAQQFNKDLDLLFGGEDGE